MRRVSAEDSSLSGVWPAAAQRARDISGPRTRGKELERDLQVWAVKG